MQSTKDHTYSETMSDHQYSFRQHNLSFSLIEANIYYIS